MLKFFIAVTFLFLTFNDVELREALETKNKQEKHEFKNYYNTSKTFTEKERQKEKNWIRDFATKVGISSELSNKFSDENKFENDSSLKYTKKINNIMLLVSVDNFKFEKQKNEYINKPKPNENEDNIYNWNLQLNNVETPITDVKLNASDFNAKDNVTNTHNRPSQSNVPEKNENILYHVNFIDQLSFINNISNKNESAGNENKKEKVSQELEGEDDLPVKNAEELANEQKDLLFQVTNYGLQQMHEMFDVKEKKIYEAGFILSPRSPGSYLATFNHQTEELKELSRYGYAALKASKKLKEELLDSKLRREMFNVTEDSAKDFPEISLLDTALHDKCPLKHTPVCPAWNHLFRTSDGTCNNLKNPWWGAIFQPLTRYLLPQYEDGLEAVRESVRGGPLPSPRIISTEVHWDKDVSSKSVTHMLMQWGQFIDHDMTSSSQSRGFNGSIPRCCDAPIDLMHPDCLPIEVPPNDKFYGNFGIRCLEFLRSAPSSRIGCGLGAREQINQVTSYIDGSMIYGNTDRESSKLRLFRNGMLKFTRMPQRLPLLPSDRDRGGFCTGFNTDFFCFLSGDLRINEQPGLIAIHIIFLRLHNRIAKQLAHLNPEWSDERLYQETRKVVGAILQHITYREFLPIVLGQEVMKIFNIEPLKEGYYDGYSEETRGSAANAFATAAFRFGHSMVQGKLLKWDDIRKEGVANVSLHDELQDSGSLHKFGAVDSLMMGMCIQEAQKSDEHLTTELTNHLFQTQSFPAGLDLAAINIQRGRDHGLPSYNSWRNPCGLRKMKNWDDLLHVMPEETRDSLRRVYRDINDIDLYAGGLSEFPVRGGLVGSTFSCIIAQHFKNIRQGDRFWYENGGFDSSFTINQLKAIRRVTLARILCDNLDLIESIQPFAFLTVDNIRNPKIPCGSRDIPFIDLLPWKETPKGKWKHSFVLSAEEKFTEMPVFQSNDHSVSNEVPTPIDLE